MGVIALLACALAAALGLRISRSIVDVIIVIVLVAVGLGVVTGPVILLSAQGAGPGDPLHALYAAAAALTLPLARMVGARRDPPVGRAMSRGLGRWSSAGAVIMLGILFRLWQTG